jgi:molecular chaperone DnaK
MVSEAESHVAEDRAKREIIDLRNQADQLAYQTEKQLVEFKDKISSDDEAQLRRALEDLKEAAKQDDKNRIRSAIERHSEIWQRVAEKMYKAADAQTGQAAGGASQPGGEAPPRRENGGDGKPVDAEYEVLDDDDKKK